MECIVSHLFFNILLFVILSLGLLSGQTLKCAQFNCFCAQEGLLARLKDCMEFRGLNLAFSFIQRKFPIHSITFIAPQIRVFLSYLICLQVIYCIFEYFINIIMLYLLFLNFKVFIYLEFQLFDCDCEYFIQISEDLFTLDIFSLQENFL